MLDEVLPLLSVAGIALLALLLVSRQSRVTRRLKSELAGLKELLQQPPPAAPTQNVNFSASLDSAERLQSSLPVGVRNSPEKYRYVAALAEQGLDAKGIAAALKLAPAEVEQLLQLALLRPPQPTAKDSCHAGRQAG